MTSENNQTPSTPPLRYADVGINLSDPIFRGIYHGKKAHEDDLDAVINRALSIGCQKFMVTGSNLIESQNAISIAKQYPSVCYATVGVHPCSTQDFDTHSGGPDALLTSLKDLALTTSASGHCVAFGEIGLDYDRLFLSPKETQLKYFSAQLQLASTLNLPLFLHSRACHTDFLALLTPYLTTNAFPKCGLVHSFTGTLSEALDLINLGFHIGINGCSLKTAENLAVVKELPLSHLQIETDGPWCEIRASHASSEYLKDWPGRSAVVEGAGNGKKKGGSGGGGGELLDGQGQVIKSVKKEKWVKGAMVKGRNEPCTIGMVAWIVAKVKGLSVEEVAEAAWKNSVGMFGLGVE